MMNSSDPATVSTKRLVADWTALMRTFIQPEDAATRRRLLKYMEQILFGLQNFLQDHVGITEAVSLLDLANRHMNSQIPEMPEKKLADVITDLIEDIAPHAVNVASPYFVGHMTSAIPFFMIHLKTIVAALNQNAVKVETSKVVSVVEKQVLARLHRLTFGKEAAFYREHVQSVHTTLGSFVEDGTLANLTALWVARNRLLAAADTPVDIEADGLAAAFRKAGIARCVVLVSRMAHYSLQKAAGILGIGHRNVIPIDTDAAYRLDMISLKRTVADLHRNAPDTRVLAVVGIAGTTETGSVDPLAALAALCREHHIHFHVDAAWGGPTLMSPRYRHLLSGIAAADSVTIDGHKQFYMPMACGMVLFNDPAAMDCVAYHARYINRPGSVDLGIKSLSGSREAVSLILDSALNIMGSRGYALLIDHGVGLAAALATVIQGHPDLELTSPPALNILTYRWCPADLDPRCDGITPEERARRIDILNGLNERVQRLQREAGKSFVSRTTLRLPAFPDHETVVLRCVLMNPLTTMDILKEIIDEQQSLVVRILSKGAAGLAGAQT